MVDVGAATCLSPMLVVAPTYPKAGGENLRDWMEAHHPKLVGLWDWPAYRLFGRCFVCDRLIILHSPWRLFICERTSLPIEITDQGRERLAEAARTQFVA